MKDREPFESPEFGKEEFDGIKDALNALHAVSGALSSDMRYVSRNAALKKELLDDPEIQQHLSELREAVAVARAIVSKIFRLISEHLAHSQTNLQPFEQDPASGTGSPKNKKKHDQMMADRKIYFNKTAHWLISTQFKNWIAPYAEEFLDVHKELTEYCLYEGVLFREFMSYTLITQCGADLALMKIEIVRIASAGDPQGEISTYQEAAGRAGDFLQNVLTPFIEDMKYAEEISKKFALQNIVYLIKIAEEIEQGG